jgi:hypothetical protein
LGLKDCHYIVLSSVDLQALHRVRERWVMRRTAVVNQIRSLLLKRGLALPKGEAMSMRCFLWDNNRFNSCEVGFSSCGNPDSQLTIMPVSRDLGG